MFPAHPVKEYWQENGGGLSYKQTLRSLFTGLGQTLFLSLFQIIVFGLWNANIISNCIFKVSTISIILVTFNHIVLKVWLD